MIATEIHGPPPPPLAVLRGISKRFGAVPVLQDVDFEVRAGEVHILAGENGAGKSTLIKILAGVHTDFAGSLHILGREVRPTGPQDGARLGIAVIHQELSLIPSLSVADNIFLGRPLLTLGGFVRQRAQRAAAEGLLRQFGLDIGPDQRVEQLPVATQQLVEIAKALSRQARIIVMDEPTSALNAPEVDKLFGLVEQLRASGCGIVYITHKMEEIERVADHITVLRDGRLIGSAPAAQISAGQLIRWMVGRDLDAQYRRRARHQGDTRLQVCDLQVRHDGKTVVHNMSLAVRAGEIVGLAGLQGSGNSHLLMGLFGAYGRATTGRVEVDGRPLPLGSPRRALGRGVALLTNDRKATGLVLPASIVANTTLARLERFSPGGWLRTVRERQATRKLAAQLQLRAASLDMPVSALSGGNQQKVVIAKWLLTEPKVLLLDEPTKGVDVGAKWEIYELMEQWTAQGIAILLVTSEMPELLAMSDRVLVMHRGCLTAEFSHEQATADAVLAAAMGRQDEEHRA